MEHVFKGTKVGKMRAVSSGKCEPFCSGDAARNDVDIAQQRNESRFQKVFQMREQCQVNPRDNVAARTACSDDANQFGLAISSIAALIVSCSITNSGVTFA